MRAGATRMRLSAAITHLFSVIVKVSDMSAVLWSLYGAVYRGNVAGSEFNLNMSPASPAVALLALLLNTACYGASIADDAARGINDIENKIDNVENATTLAADERALNAERRNAVAPTMEGSSREEGRSREMSREEGNKLEGNDVATQATRDNGTQVTEALTLAPALQQFMAKNKQLLEEFISRKQQATASPLAQRPVLRAKTPARLRQAKTKAKAKQAPTGALLLDMAPAVGSRVQALRVKGSLCHRSVLHPEGPKFGADGLPRKTRPTKRAFEFTKRPHFLLPRCCNCCQKSVLGCQ